MVSNLLLLWLIFITFIVDITFMGDATDVEELITEILGKENPSLISVVGGIDSGDNTDPSS